MPPVLFILRVENVGGLVELRTGETVPLKLITPVEFEMIAFINRIVCTVVPEKFVIPLLMSEPLFVRLPCKVAIPLPPSNEPPETIYKVPL